MKKHLGLKTTAFLCLCLVGLLSSFYFNQEKMLFQHTQVDINIPYQSTHVFEELYFDTRDSSRLHAVHFKCENPKGIVVYFHGRGSNLMQHLKRLPENFLSRSYDVLVLDYRNFGKSRGHLSEQALLEDATLVYEYANKHFSSEKIVLYGRSLGTGLATYVASQYPAKCLILEAPYYSMLELACEKYPFLPKSWVSFILKYRLRTDQWIQNVSAPIFIFHGDKDDLIPHNASLKLYNLVQSTHQVSLVIIPDCNHSNLPKYEMYQKKLSEILK